jgi:hypothetical protein
MYDHFHIDFTTLSFCRIKLAMSEVFSAKRLSKAKQKSHPKTETAQNPISECQVQMSHLIIRASAVLRRNESRFLINSCLTFNQHSRARFLIDPIQIAAARSECVTVRRKEPIQ